jgi:hypothetical protein
VPEVREFVAATGTCWIRGSRVCCACRCRRARAWAAFSVAVCAPRQNGKNAILEMRELLGCLPLGERLRIHSGIADTSKERSAVSMTRSRRPSGCRVR